MMGTIQTPRKPSSSNQVQRQQQQQVQSTATPSLLSNTQHTQKQTLVNAFQAPPNTPLHSVNSSKASNKDLNSSLLSGTPVKKNSDSGQNLFQGPSGFSSSQLNLFSTPKKNNAPNNVNSFQTPLQQNYHRKSGIQSSFQATPNPDSKNTFSLFTERTPLTNQATFGCTSNVNGGSITDLPPPTLNFKKLQENGAKRTPLHSSSNSSSSSFVNLSMKSEPSLTYYTPQTKLAKPMPSAFLSTGLISKKNRPRPQQYSKPTPNTPAKRLNFHSWMEKNCYRPSALDPVSVKKQRTPLQESPIKAQRDNILSTPTHSNNKNFSHFNFETSPYKLSPLRFSKPDNISPPKSRPLFSLSIRKDRVPDGLLDQHDENCLSSDEVRSRSRCVSTPETRFKSDLFVPHNQPSPIKLSKRHTPYSSIQSNFGENYNTSQWTPLMKTKQFDWHTSYQIYTPFPRFIDLKYLQKFRDPNAPMKESFSDDHIFPDYFKSHFQVIERLGEGAFSSAYKVYSKVDHAKYAIKKSKSPYQGYRERIQKLQEVETMFLLKGCQRCVQLVHAWEQYGYLHMQMELCEDGTLQSWVDEATRVLPLEEFQIWHILAEIVMGLKEIHDKNVIHLDIKPENIFLDGSKLKIGDFGLATYCPVLDGIEREGDRTYIAPEILGSRYDKSADIFSVGLIVLELCGNVVLPENGEYWQMLRSGDFSEIQFRNLSPHLIELVQSMLSPDPEKRPSADKILSNHYVQSFVQTDIPSTPHRHDLPYALSSNHLQEMNCHSLPITNDHRTSNNQHTFDLYNGGDMDMQED